MSCRVIFFSTEWVVVPELVSNCKRGKYFAQTVFFLHDIRWPYSQNYSITMELQNHKQPQPTVFVESGRKKIMHDKIMSAVVHCTSPKMFLFIVHILIIVLGNKIAPAQKGDGNFKVFVEAHLRFNGIIANLSQHAFPLKVTIYELQFKQKSIYPLPWIILKGLFLKSCKIRNNKRFATLQSMQLALIAHSS